MKHKPRYGVTLRQATLRLAEAFYGSFEEWIQTMYDDGIWEIELCQFVMARGFSYLEYSVVRDFILKRRNEPWRPGDMPLVSESNDSHERWGALHLCRRNWGSVTNWAAYMLRCRPGWGRKELILEGVRRGLLEEEMDAAWIALPAEAKLGRNAEYKLESTTVPQKRSGAGSIGNMGDCEAWISMVQRYCPGMRPDLIEAYGQAKGFEKVDLRKAFAHLGVKICDANEG
jgi:hypothetical protein